MNQEYSLAQEYNHQGLVLYSKDKYEDAKAYFEKAIYADPHHVESYINMAQVYIALDQYDDAKKYLNKALLIDKKCAIVYFHLGNIDLLQNNTEGARTYYNKAISLGYDNAQIYINLAVDAEERNDFETAISYYNKAIALDKFNALAKARKAQILIALKRLPEALSVSDSLLETNPDVFEGYHYKFAILTEMNKWDEAEAVLNRALELFPDDDALYYDKARLLQMQKRLDEAIDLIDSKLDFSGDNRTSLTTFKAEVLLALGKTDEALSILQDEYPKSKDGEVAFLLNSIHIAKKEYDEVLKYSQDIITNSTIDKYYHSALYYHAVALSKLGRTEEATKEFKNALKFFRAACSREPGQIQLYFYRAMCHEELKQYNQALELLDYILSVDEELYEAHLVRANIYEATGKLTEAANKRSIIQSNKPELLQMMEE